MLTLLVASPARAIVVLKRGVSQPIMGHLIRQDERTIVVREELPGGGFRETHVSRSEIDELIITVSPERLAALDPSRPQLYREYAEELAEKRRDPEARDAARRLFAIAAARGDERLRKGALLGLIGLARSPEEERRLRAAAWLYDPAHDSAVLTAVSPPAADPAAAGPPPSELLTALQSIRQGRGAEAKALLELPHVHRAAARLDDVLKYDELLAAATRTPTDELLARLIHAELVLAGQPRPAAAANDQPAWSQLIRGGQLAPLPSLELASLTEFNPAECVYKSGQWMRP